MKDFAGLLYELDQTNKTSLKLSVLRDYIAKADHKDKIWTIALLSGRRPRRPVTTTQLKTWACETSGMPPWLFSECYEAVGDLAETIALILPPPNSSQDKTLSFWISFLSGLSDKDDEKKKSSVISAWKQMNTGERFAFNKLLTGSFRIGVSQRMMVRALSELYDIDNAKIAHRLTGKWHPETDTFHELVLEEKPGEDASKPYPFYLAYQLESKIDELGAPSQWFAEWKWDGIRSQLIKRNGELFIWSRGEELVTEKYPELHVLADHLPDSVALDGEIIAFRNGKPLSFNTLQKRIGRKKLTRKIIEEAPVSIITYDIMEYEGRDIRDEPLEKRKGILEEIAESIGSEKIMISENISFDNWEQLAEWRNKARTRGTEGLMLKRSGSLYGYGRKKGDWWKWKLDPLTIDAVLIYAQRGHGRRSSLYSDYTLALWKDGELVPVAKAYSGLTNKELRELDSFIRKNTVERFGPVRSVKPEMVFEIAFENIRRSARHKSGIALRFPRIHRWRKDKQPKDADKLETLYHMLEE